MKELVQHGADKESLVTHRGARITMVGGNATSDAAHVDLRVAKLEARSSRHDPAAPTTPIPIPVTLKLALQVT